MDSRPLSRRAFVAGGMGLALAGLVTRRAHGLAVARAFTSGAATARRKPISALVLSSDLYASPEPQRFVFATARGARYASVGPARVAFAAPGERQGTVLASTLYTRGLPEGRGIYVVDATFAVPGVWRAVAFVQGRQVPFAVRVKASPDAPRPGAVASRAPSPTPASPLGVDPICTRRPRCPLHDVSLADVLGTGRPVAVLFATPALCQSQYCGPVLDELLEVMGPYRDRVTLVHVEIYTSTRGATTSPTVQAWGLPSEPWLYTVDGAGIIRDRLDGAFATDEITAALDRLVAT